MSSIPSIALEKSSVIDGLIILLDKLERWPNESPARMAMSLAIERATRRTDAVRYFGVQAYLGMLVLGGDGWPSLSPRGVAFALRNDDTLQQHIHRNAIACARHEADSLAAGMGASLKVRS